MANDEPKIHSHRGEKLPDDHWLATSKLNCAYCGELLYSEETGTRVTWVETGRVMMAGVIDNAGGEQPWGVFVYCIRHFAAQEDVYPEMDPRYLFNSGVEDPAEGYTSTTARDTHHSHDPLTPGATFDANTAHNHEH